jgi:hypothetical protein
MFPKGPEGKFHSISSQFIDWLIDWLLHNKQYFIYIQDENKFSTIYKNYIGRDGDKWAMTLDCHRKCMERRLGTKHLFFCRGYNMSTPFWNLQRQSLTCLEHGIFHTRYPLWSMVRFSIL